MRAVLFEGRLRFSDRHPDCVAAAGQTIVDVTRAGICETDLQLCRGYMGFSGVLGHEFVGIARTGRFAGRRVVGEINCACRECKTCLADRPGHCPHRSVIGILNHNGAFADSVVVPDVNLYAVPDHVPDDHAVFVEPLAAACRIPQQMDLSGDERVIVLGDGRLGNLCAQVLRFHGCDVTVVGKHDFKLQIAAAAGVATCRLDDCVPDRTADIVVDCTGSPTGLPTAMQFVRPCGTIVLKTTVAAESTLHLAPLVIDEVRLIGSRCGPFADALKLLADHSVQVAPLICDRFPLEQAEQAFERAVQKNVLKVLLDVI